MDIKDIVGFGEPIKRLVEVVAKGIGNVYQPLHIKRLADAKAYEIKTVGNALSSVSDANQLPVTYKDGAIDMWLKPEDNTLEIKFGSVAERVESRISFQEHKRQANIESVVAAAAEELLIDESISTEPPDDDWITRFFDTSQNISSEQMQQLWGKVLAGEIREPGSYSLRTLDFLKNLTVADARIIETISKFTLRHLRDSLIIQPDAGAWLQNKGKLYHGHRIAGCDLAVLTPNDLSLKVFDNPKQAQVFFESDEKILLLNRTDATYERHINIWKLTPLGAELVKLCAQPVDIEYLEEVSRYFSTLNMDVVLADVTSRDSSGVHYTNARSFPSVSNAS